MSKFNIHEEVIVKDLYNATVIGYFSNELVIVLYEEPQQDGSFGQVVHESEIQPIFNEEEKR